MGFEQETAAHAMICVLSRKRDMGLRKEVACWVLLLMLLQVETSCLASGSGRFGRLKNGSYSNFSPVESKGGFGGNEDGDGAFGVEKRKIYTGPNPLHNR